MAPSFRGSSPLSRRRFLFAVSALAVMPPAHAAKPSPSFWIDRLETPGTSLLGTRWVGVTDRVMGGVSDLETTVGPVDGEMSYRMRGRVRTANHGGFIQMALPLSTRLQEPLDARAWTGVRIRVRGNGETYAVHLRTPDHRMPWDYHRAVFQADSRWRDIALPFADFVSSRAQASLDTHHLQRLALVGIGRDFEADLAIASVALYRRT